MPNTSRFTPAQEGLQLWSITGRCFNDDDDTASLCWGMDEAEATTEFKLSSLDLTHEQLGSQADENRDPEYFLVSSELVGVVKNGEFVLSASLMPMVDDLPGNPAADEHALFEVSIFGEVHDGSRLLVESRCLVARSAQEAESCMEHRYFPAQWDSSSYARPSFTTRQVRALDNECQPDLYSLVEWLKTIFDSLKTPAHVVPAFWNLLAENGVQLEESSDDPRSEAVLRNALVQLASRMTGMAAMYELLSRPLPEHSNFEAEDGTEFGYDNEELQWPLPRNPKII